MLFRSHLSVPVHSPAGEVLLVLRLSALPRGAGMPQVRHWLQRLQLAAANLERKIAARPSRPMHQDC